MFSIFTHVVSRDTYSESWLPMVQLHKFVRDQLVKGCLQSKLENSYKSLFIWKRQFCIVLMV